MKIVSLGPKMLRVRQAALKMSPNDPLCNVFPLGID